MASFFYDDFNDASIHSRWSYQDGDQGDLAEAGGVWTLTKDAGSGNTKRGQLFDAEDFDVYGSIDWTYTSVTSDGLMQCIFYALDFNNPPTTHPHAA